MKSQRCLGGRSTNPLSGVSTASRKAKHFWGLASLYRAPRGVLPVACVLSICALEGAALALTLEVDPNGSTPYQTIQSAINAAVPGVDQVLVHCGIYQENVVMINQVSVTGAGPGCAVIDGGANGTAVTMVNTDSLTVLKGFTIRNGRSGCGGGLFIQSGSPMISGNVITGNRAVSTGTCGGAPAGVGGGIHITTPAGTTLLVTAPTITRNIIQGNRADGYGGGIEVYAGDGPTIISNNLIKGNTAGQAGGGVDSYLAFPMIVNNTIVRNCLQGAGTACALGGGGVAVTSSGGTHITNNLVAWNEAAAGGGGVDVASTSPITILSNDAFQNVPSNYAGVSPTGSNGNIAINPDLVDEYDNFGGHQPRSNSPLVEAANLAEAPTVDLRGIPRPIDSNANGTALPDIGARENEGITNVKFASGSKISLAWDPSIGTSLFYPLYRGDMQTLRTTGIYMQDPNIVPGARRRCGLTTPAVTDEDSPATGESFFYIAVVKKNVNGTLGFDSTPTERPYVNANACP